MKKYGLFTIIGIGLLLFSACGLEDVGFDVNNDTPKIARKPLSEEKVLRFVVPFKKKGERVEKRSYTFYTNADDNLFDRYGIKMRTETFLGQSQKDLLINPRKSNIDYAALSPVRISSFLDNPVAYGSDSYYTDPTSKKVLGVTYNTREGYLRSAKIDQEGYQKGYIESMQDSEEAAYEDDSFENDYERTEYEDKNNADSFFFGSQKGYIEAYTEKYGKAPTSPTGNYLEDKEEENGERTYTTYSSNSYLSEIPNGLNSEGSKNYLEALSEENFNSQKGYLENTFVSDFNDDGVANDGNWQRKGNYLDNVIWTSSQSGYLENLGFSSSGSRGYIESMAAFGESPNISTYGF
ncbi:MAG: hypothetical protein RBS56_02790 [Candidatus Gracilibacteria bacterium]|jgi:hypothetical protein|nr:hypothetical protein [Candidatus Gracilibacteria bacterium]